MDELIAFLRERYAEDEAVMRRVLQFSTEGYAQGAYESWVAERKFNHVEAPNYDYQSVRTERTATRPVELVRLDPIVGRFLADHIARFGSPARVLADVAAKRAIVDAMAKMEDVPHVIAIMLAKETLHQLALPYADHPAFQEAWRP